ncbi:redoxin domain-containing protein [Herbidospora sp. NEAU-GS84]|uniref:thioredoxin-dependent peroxiredoxin n=1 Tax=Herbidospora solisilvae TaxID=2696284 RepID=A0A7C9J9Z9_9ACTN|nr:peroxiredoxin [Herbidospora solisilvae]NAS24248.1 redoxin domain-containing protein [Herbidospora solisilvae]
MKIGELVADFALPDENGETRRLSEFLKEGPVVLFFYPAAMTSGCTTETCHFRDLAAEFTSVGAVRVGISKDKVKRQKMFAEGNRLDFPLLSDEEGLVAKQMGVRRSVAVGPFVTRRVTFVIDTDFRVVDVIHNEVVMTDHADRALKTLRDRA